MKQTNGRKWWKYSPEFKRQAVDRMFAGESVSAVAKELGIRRKFLYAWRVAGLGSAGPQPPLRAVKRQKREASASERQATALNKRIAELERLVGRQAAELDFFAAALRSIEESRPTSSGDSGNESTPRSRRLRKAH